jgi:NSS family neurotransmitter:Na+ symporter
VVSKIVMITVPLPVLLLVIFVVRGLTLPGAVEGLNYYLSPDFSVLTDPQVWLAAYGQIFFSLSLGFGVMITYASYLKPSSDVNNNAFMTSFGNCSTSFFAGLAVFSALGFLARSTGRDVADVVSSGPGLAFVTYPTIIDKLPAAPLFALAFFVMLLTLGIDSAFSLVEGVVTGICDRWAPSKSKVVGVVCVIGFVVGLVFTTGGGLYWLDIVDHYVTYLALPFVGLIECLAVAAILKTSRLREHTNETSDFRVGRWWDLCIAVITPLLIGAVFVVYLYRRIGDHYAGYPALAQALGGWLVFGMVIAGGVLLMVLARRETSSEETHS